MAEEINDNLIDDSPELFGEEMIEEPYSFEADIDDAEIESKFLDDDNIGEVSAEEVEEENIEVEEEQAQEEKKSLKERIKETISQVEKNSEVSSEHEIFSAEIVEDEVFANKKYLRFKLSQFEGPLDLLCTLVSENKVEIEDIFVSDITGQYLEIVTNSSFDDVEYASEFLIMAATLLEIKSKRLLPVPETDENMIDTAEYDEMMIIRQVKEYKLFKETSEKLAEQEALYQFTKEPVYTEDDYRIALTDFNLDKLVDAFAKIITRAEIKAEEIKPRTIIKERFTVSNRIKHIARSIFEVKKLNFFDLYDEDFTKIEVINTFLAILELLKRQFITASQESEFSNIYLELRDGVDTMLTFDEGDEEEIGY